MTRRQLIPLLAALCIGAALVSGGSAPFGRVALSLGFGDLAARWLTAPDWRGVALLQAGKPLDAAQVFEQAEAHHGYNAGTAYALAGDYAKALEVLDAHLLIFPNDRRAQENYEMIRTYYAGTLIEPDSEIITKIKRDGPVVEAEIGQGDARAASTGTKANNQVAGLELPTLMGRGPQGVRRVFDDHYYEANRRWLKSLPDLPGEYLAERIKHEHKRRAKLGIGQPAAPEGDAQ